MMGFECPNTLELDKLLRLTTPYQTSSGEGLEDSTVVFIFTDRNLRILSQFSVVKSDHRVSRLRRLSNLAMIKFSPAIANMSAKRDGKTSSMS